MALRHDDVRLETGPRLHFVEQGDASGRPVLFLHGWPDSWFTYSRVLPPLPADVRALAVDQRASATRTTPSPASASRSSPPMPWRFSMRSASSGPPSWAIRTVRSSHGASPFSRPERVDGLVLIGTGFVQTSPAVRELGTAVLDLPDPIPVEFAREFQASTAYRPLPPDFFERIVTESLKIPARLWRPMVDRLLEYDDAGFSSPKGVRSYPRLAPRRLRGREPT